MLLEVKDLVKSFGETEVLHGISFSAESGGALGLLGRNGAGKTTTIRILMDVFHADSGEITLDGVPFVPKEHWIGYLPEERGLYPKKKVGEQMVYLARLRGVDKGKAAENVDRWLERMEIPEYKNEKLETLSKGNQQKVQLAATLVANPEIIILDEPFSGLDPVNAGILKDVINEQIDEGKVVIFSSHQMSYVEEFCDNITVLNHGDVVLSGNLKDIKREFGENKLVLSSDNYPLPELKGVLERQMADIVTIVDEKKDYFVLKQKPNVTRERILGRLLNSSVKIERFGTFEPSLNDIFVAKAGDEDE